MSARVVRLLYWGDVEAFPRRLRDGGHEVVLLGAGASPEQLAAISVQEDVGLIAVADPELGATAVPALERDVVVFWVTSATDPS
jgi:hypothetical protein